MRGAGEGVVGRGVARSSWAVIRCGFRLLWRPQWSMKYKHTRCHPPLSRSRLLE